MNNYITFGMIKILLVHLYSSYYLGLTVTFSLLYLFDRKLADLFFYKAQCTQPKYRAQIRGFARVRIRQFFQTWIKVVTSIFV